MSTGGQGGAVELRQSLGDPRPRATQEPRKPSLWSGSTRNDPCPLPTAQSSASSGPRAFHLGDTSLDHTARNLPPFQYNLATTQIWAVRVRISESRQTHPSARGNPTGPGQGFTCNAARGLNPCLAGIRLTRGRLERRRSTSASVGVHRGPQPGTALVRVRCLTDEGH